MTKVLNHANDTSIFFHEANQVIKTIKYLTENGNTKDKKLNCIMQIIITTGYVLLTCRYICIADVHKTKTTLTAQLQLKLQQRLSLYDDFYYWWMQCAMLFNMYILALIAGE